MAVGITQAGLNAFGFAMMRLLPTTTVAYRDSGMINAPILSLDGHWIEYSQREKSLNPVLLTMRKFRIEVLAFQDRPTQNSILTCPTGERWEVKSITGGPGRAFWFLHCAQVG